MIITQKVITVNNDSVILSSKVYLFRGDRKVTIMFDILESPFQVLGVGTNVIEITGSKYAQMLIRKPDNSVIATDILEVEENKAKIEITGEMIDELSELGTYDMQIRLYSDDLKSRVSLPIIEDGLELLEGLNTSNDISDTKIAEEEEIVTFLEDGSYNLTLWSSDSVITDSKLNKIEQAIDVINDMARKPDVDLSDYVTEEEMSVAIANAQLGGGDGEVDLSAFATQSQLETKADKEHEHSQYLTSVPDEYVTETELADKGYLTEHQDISHLATKEEVEAKSDIGHTHDYADKNHEHNYLTEIPSDYVTESELANKGFLTSHQDISNLATKEEVEAKSDTGHNHDDKYYTETEIDTKLNNYAKKTELHTHSNKTVLDGITSTKITSWDNKSDLSLGATSSTAYRGDLGNKAYLHSQLDHAPYNAQKNSDIKKAEIEAKLTGDISSHTHSQYLTEIPSEYITETELNKALANIEIGDGSVDLTGYVTTETMTTELAKKSDTGHTHEEYLTQHQDISHLANKEHEHTQYLTEIPSEYITETELTNKKYATETFVNTAISNAQIGGGDVDLSGYALKTEIPTTTSELTNDSDFTTKTYVDEQIANISGATGSEGIDTSNFITTDEIRIIGGNEETYTFSLDDVDEGQEICIMKNVELTYFDSDGNQISETYDNEMFRIEVWYDEDIKWIDMVYMAWSTERVFYTNENNELILDYQDEVQWTSSMEEYATKEYVDNAVANNSGSSGGTGDSDTLTQLSVSDSTLTLTTDKYQFTKISEDISLNLPDVSDFVEIHLFVSETNATITMPSDVRWQNADIQSTRAITLEEKAYEFVFTYVNSLIGWLAGCIIYG